MKKILVHIGLPKTATTSLQENVLMQLHNDGKINFLGKTIDNNYYLFSKIYRELAKKELDDQEIANLKEDFDKILDRSLLNVISSEGLSSGDVNNLKVLWLNFEKILSFYEVNIVISLRNPKDFIFSYYVENFRWKYQFDKERDTFQKFLNDIAKNKDNPEYDTIFFERLFYYINGLKTKVILYEDLKQDSNFYNMEFGKLLGIDSSEFSKLFNTLHKNEKKKTVQGRYSDSTTLNQYISKAILFLREKAPFLKKIPFYKEIIEAVIGITSKVKIAKPVEHVLPDDYTSFIENIVFSKEYENFIKNLSIDKDKLYKYGYLKN